MDNSKKAKKFAASIYLYHTHAVATLQDRTIIDKDPVRLAGYYSEHNTDALFVFDLSSNDAEHEEALDLIKAICETVEVDVYGGGNVHRMEDIKKLLYAGCRKAILDYDNPENISITEEVSKKFGKDKLLASCSDPNLLEAHRSLLEESVSGLVLFHASEIQKAAALTALPLYVQIHELALDELPKLLSSHTVLGITGNTINNNVKELLSLKELCKEKGIAVAMLDAAYPWSAFQLNSDGLLPVVVQDHITSEVLMVAYMDEEAYLNTLRTGKMTYFSRSRKELWLKGATSGHFQYVKSLTADCDMDTLLAQVSQVGAACHTGSRSCFFHEVVKKDSEASGNPLKVFEDVYAVILDRKLHPKEGSYTNYLFDKGIDKILKKLGEEATEIVIAAKNPNPNEVKYEISDFLYHMMVLMAEKEVTWEEITEELAKR